MRRWIVRSLKLVLLLAALVAIDRYVRRDEIREAARQRYTEELQRVIMPRVEFHEATLDEALAYLRSEARKAGWQGDLRLIVLSESEARKRFHRKVQDTSQPAGSEPVWNHAPPMIPGLRPLPGTAPAYESTAYEPHDHITFTLTNIPLFEACKYVAGLSDHGMFVNDGAVEFTPSTRDGTYEPYVERRFSHFRAQQLSTAPKMQNGNLDARALLVSCGIDFYEGASAEYDPRRDTLIMVNTAENADLVDYNITGRYEEPTRMQAAMNWLHALFHRDAPDPMINAPAALSPVTDGPAVSGSEPLPGAEAPAPTSP